MVRDGDYDLGTPSALMRKKSDFDHRIALINHSNADYYISIHMNYLQDESYFGPQVFYTSSNYDLASKFQSYLNSVYDGKREVKKIPSSIYMYGRLKVPGVLVECGFLSNAMDRKNFEDDSYIESFSSSLAQVFLSL